MSKRSRLGGNGCPPNGQNGNVRGGKPIGLAAYTKGRTIKTDPDDLIDCPSCDGSGKSYDECPHTGGKLVSECDDCQGYGRVRA